MSEPSESIVRGAEGVSPRAAWTSVAILTLFAVFSVIDRQIISLLIDPIKHDLHLSDTQIGLLQGLAFAVFYSVAGIPLGWAADRFPRKIVCYVGLTLWSLCATACGLAGSFRQLFAARILVGVGEASLSPSAVSLISDLFPRERIGAPMGVYASGYSVGAGVALIVSGYVVGLFVGQPQVNFPWIGSVASWQAVFIVTGLPGIAIALLAFLLTDRRPRVGIDRPAANTTGSSPPGPPGPPGPPEGFFIRHGKLVFLLFGGFGWASFLFYAVGAWTPAFLSRTFGLAPSHIGWAWGIIVAASGGIGALAGGFMIDRCYRNGLRDACIVVPAIAALIAWPFTAIGYLLPSPILVLVSLGVGIVMVGVVSAGSFATWRRIAPPHLRGRVSATFSLVAVGMGASLGPVIPALVTDRVLKNEALVGRSLAITVSVALPLLAIMLLAARRPLRDVPEP